MSRRFVQVFGAVLAICAIIGWFRSGLAPATGAQMRDAWVHGDGGAEKVQYLKVAKRLKKTGLFPASKRLGVGEAAGGGIKGSNGKGAPAPFPVIVAAAIVDGAPHVYLRLAGGKIIPAASGFVLESGWELKTVDLTRVLAVYDGQEQEFKITNYEEREGGAAAPKMPRKR